MWLQAYAPARDCDKVSGKGGQLLLVISVHVAG